MSERKSAEEWARNCTTFPYVCCDCMRGYADQELAPFLEVAQAGEAFEKKFAKIKDAIDGAFAFQQIHGFTYQGENCGKELRALRDALSHPAVQAWLKEARDE